MIEIDVSLEFVNRVFEDLIYQNCNPESVLLCHKIAKTLSCSKELTKDGYARSRVNSIINFIEGNT
jgi:hypothetical protein